MIIFQIIQWNLPLVYTVFMTIMQKSQKLEIKIDTCCFLNIHILYKDNTKWSFLSYLIIKKVNLYHSGCMTLTVLSSTNFTLHPKPAIYHSHLGSSNLWVLNGTSPGKPFGKNKFTEQTKPKQNNNPGSFCYQEIE